jgi:CFEM domain
MIASLFFVIISLVPNALAQSVAPPPGTPQCAISCSNEFCPTSDLTCICVTELSPITSCILANCTGSDLTAAENLGPQLCGKKTAIDGIDSYFSQPHERHAQYRYSHHHGHGGYSHKHHYVGFDFDRRYHCQLPLLLTLSSPEYGLFSVFSRFFGFFRVVFSFVSLVICIIGIAFCY